MGTTKIDRRKLGVKVKAFGKTYDSFKALALDTGVNVCSLKTRMKALGLSAEKAVVSMREDGRLRTRGTSVTIRGKKYKSISFASEVLDVPKGRIASLMRAHKLDANEAYEYYVTSLGEATGERVRVDGVLYPSKTLASEAVGIHRHMFSKLYAEGLRSSKEMLKKLQNKKRDLEGTGYIYIIENSINDKVYVGLTAKSVRARFAQHLKAAADGRESKLCAAIRKHGSDKFMVRQLKEAPKSELARLEKRLIDKHQSAGRGGYNQNEGGSVGGCREFGDTVTYRGTKYLDFRHLCATVGISEYRSQTFLRQGKSIAWIVKEGQRWNSLSVTHQKAAANGTLVTYQGRHYSIKEFTEVFGLTRYKTEARFRSGWSAKDILSAE